MKYALVTGGSRGIGRAACVRLAQMGYHILVNYVNKTDAAEETLELVRQEGQDGELLKFDVSNLEQTRGAIEAWQQAHPDEYIEVLVNNAGIRRDNLMALMPAEDWTTVLQITLNGFYNVTQPILPAMQLHKFGRIINMASLSGLKGLPGQTNYSAAKGGIIGATKALAQEVARRNITVNAIAPGFIETKMTQHLDKKLMLEYIPMKCLGNVNNVADSALFLASDMASYITGQTLQVDGGMFI
jgi:3-oxoacyl-[acyl-carrier protein] reductase